MSKGNSNGNGTTKQKFVVSGAYVTAYANAEMTVWANSEDEAIEAFQEAFWDTWHILWFSKEEQEGLPHEEAPADGIKWTYDFWIADEQSLGNVEVE